VAWAHEFDRKNGVSAVFVELANSDFTLNGAQADENTALLRAGLNGALTPRFSISARLESERGESVSEVGGVLQARLRF
jgi:uncharacterized protein with beta-barrel porin domain